MRRKITLTFINRKIMSGHIIEFATFYKQEAQGQRLLQNWQEMTLALVYHIPSFTPSVLFIYHFSGLRLQPFSRKKSVFTFSYVKAYVSKIDLAVK